MFAAITLYSIVLFLHIAAVTIAFGVTFTYPLVAPLTERLHREHVPYMLRMQALVGQRIITPAATVILLAGVYLVADGHWEFSEWWITVGLLVVLVLLGLAGAFFTPTERRLADIAERDLGSDAAEFSEEYQRLSKRLGRVGGLASLATLVAIFTMVMGSRGYLS